jgi:hypothetical protein
MGNSTKIAIIIVTVALLIGIAYFMTADNGRHNPMNVTDEIVITVESTHILFSANYTLYIDGEVQDTWSMGAGGSKIYKYTHTQPKSYGNTAVVISVQSTGGGLGAQYDSKTVTVGNGQVHSITLRA